MLAFKLFLKKFLIFLKNYWYVPLVILGIIVGWFFLRGQKSELLVGILKKSIETHKKEIDVLEKTHEKEIEKRDEALKDYLHKVETINKTFEKENIELTERQKKEIEKIVKENKDDPIKLVERISKTTGFKIELIEESHEDES